MQGLDKRKKKSPSGGAAKKFPTTDYWAKVANRTADGPECACCYGRLSNR